MISNKIETIIKLSLKRKYRVVHFMSSDKKPATQQHLTHHSWSYMTYCTSFQNVVTLKGTKPWNVGPIITISLSFSFWTDSWVQTVAACQRFYCLHSQPTHNIPEVTAPLFVSSRSSEWCVCWGMCRWSVSASLPNEAQHHVKILSLCRLHLSSPCFHGDL